MHFTWSWALYGLLLVPLLIALYVLLLRRKRKYAVRYASLSLVREALPGRSRWRRHLPFALLVLSLAALTVAFARPQATVTVSMGRTSIILALDVSRSMCATDVDPNRMAVAQDAASDFVDDQPSGTRIGIVAFAGTAQLVVAPTDDKERLKDAIESLTTSVGTVVGAAILKSIDALAEVNPEIAPSTVDLQDTPSTEPQPPTGNYVPDIVVLLTDGANTRGVDPIVAAEQAAERRVRVYTIGFGTKNPGALVCTPEQLGGEFGGQFGAPGGPGIGGSGPGGISQFLLIDEPTLEGIADTTGGEYYPAENAEELVDVFQDLPSRVVHQDEERELTVAFAAIGALLALSAVGLSLWWNRYP
jgi:Ca-activated chloride channel family protein